MTNVRQNSTFIKLLLAVFLVVTLLVFETLSAETRYRVKSSDNVNTIVERYYPNSELSRGQLLVGILIKNPRAFKGGNVNFLLRGKRLILPNEKEFEKISPEKASELLSEHARFFRFGLAGDLPIPTLSEMRGVSKEPNESTGILVKQKAQTQKIDKLQLESSELKKQLELLLNEKTDRDQRLLELEKSLNQSLTTAKKPIQSSSFDATADRSQELEKPKLNTGLEQKIENLPAVIDVKIESNDNSEKRIIEPSPNILSKLIWLLPLLFLGLFLFYIFGKKRAAPQVDDVVKVNVAGFIEPFEDAVAEFQYSSIDEEESVLETSVKLDVARAYIEAEDTQSALDILTEIMEEGSEEQRQQAHELLEKIS